MSEFETAKDTPKYYAMAMKAEIAHLEGYLDIMTKLCLDGCQVN